MNSNYLSRVRESCALVRSSEVWINEKRLNEFASSLDVDAVRRFGSTLSSTIARFDVVFASREQEVNMIAVAHALDFGSGFRRELHAHRQLGAWQTVKQAMERMFRHSDGRIDSEFLSKLDVLAVFELFFGSSQQEHQQKQQHQQPQPLMELAELFLVVCNEIGTQCLARGFKSLGAMILAKAQQQEQQEQRKMTANDLVSLLVDSFSKTFDDRYRYSNASGEDEITVFLYKKAQLVVGELFYRFRNEEPLLNFADGERLTAFVDNVIVAALRLEGVVETSKRLSDHIAQGKLIESGEFVLFVFCFHYGKPTFLPPPL